MPKALAPKRTQINLLNEYYLNKSVDQNSSQLINMYLEADTNNGKYPTVAFPTPGTTLFNTNSTGPVLGMIFQQGVLYAVCGSQFNSYTSNGTLTTIGNLQTSTGPIEIVSINGQIMIVDGTFGYLYTISNNSFQIISNAQTTLTNTASGGTNTIVVNSASGMSNTDNIVIQLDTGSFFTTTITNISGTTLTLGSNLPSQASSGNLVVDSPLPPNPSHIASQDNFFFCSGANSNFIFQSAVGNGLSWNPLTFNAKDGTGDFVAAMVSNKNYLYVLGQYQSVIYYDAGNQNFSFAPVGAGAYFYLGCAAPKSVARSGCTILKARDINSANTFLDYESIIFLAQSPNGGLQVVLLDQYKPIQISNRAIAYQINKLSVTSDAIGYCYDQNGHSFYVLTFPTAGVTFQYDLTNGLWNQLKYYNGSSYTRHISNSYAFGYNLHLVGDYQSGNLYYLDPTNYTDNGNQIIRQIVTPPGYIQGKKTFLDRLQLDLQTGVGSNQTFTLEVSKDSGETFGTTYTGTIPAFGGRIFWTTLGMTQNAFVSRVTYTGNSNFTVLGALADIKTGIH